MTILEMFKDLTAGDVSEPYDALSIRDKILAATDYAFLTDSPLAGTEEQEKLRKIRQHLRDINKQPGFPSDIDWGIWDIISKWKAHHYYKTGEQILFGSVVYDVKHDVYSLPDQAPGSAEALNVYQPVEDEIDNAV